MTADTVTVLSDSWKLGPETPRLTPSAGTKLHHSHPPTERSGACAAHRRGV